MNKSVAHIQKHKKHQDHWIVKISLQILCLAVCFSFFIYQTSQLVTVYFSGKTIVENRVERFKYSRLPAVTVCVPAFMSMDKFAQHFLKNSNEPQFRKYYQEFLELKEQTTVSWSDQAIEKHSRLFEKFLYEVYLKRMNISWRDSFDKIMADILMGFKGTKNRNGPTNFEFKKQAYNEHGQLIRLEEPKQVHSLVPFLDPRKCITLFSDFDDYYRDMRLSPVWIWLQFEHKNMSFPLNLYYQGEFYIALHSSNILPDYMRENIFQKLNMGVANFITYSESQIRLLPDPFETQCREYKLSSNGVGDTRNDCILKCVDHRIVKKYNLSCIWSWANFKLMRKENLEDQLDRRLCDHQTEPRIEELVDDQFEMTKLCQDLCPKNCFESFYSYEIQTRNGQEFREEPNMFSININHNRFPDQIIEHKPILDWITLVSNVGGLLGMWLGLSILFIGNAFLNKIFEKFFNK